MKNLPSLVALYNDLDRYLDSVRTRAEVGSDQTALERAEKKQRLNQQAYFIICWGQLESEIDDACRAAIRKGQAKPDWNERRAWDLYNPEDKRFSGLSFEDRAALVLDKGGGKGSPWALALRYYALRNQIAHGTIQSERIDVTNAAADFYKIQAAIAR